MQKTYEELTQDTEFMEKVFAEIGKLDSVIDNHPGEEVAEMNLSVEEKSLVDAVDLTVRNMFKLAGCSDNLPMTVLQDLIDLYSEVYETVGGMDDAQLDVVERGLEAFKDPATRREIRENLYDIADML